MLRYPCMLLSSGYYAEDDEARDRRKRSFMVDANTDHRRFRIILLCTNASRNCYRSTRGEGDRGRRQDDNVDDSGGWSRALENEQGIGK